MHGSVNSPPLRLASVSFVNSLLINYGLADDPQLRLALDVPSRLLAKLSDGSADVALLPTIDYPLLPGAQVLAATGIACEGPTLTVRLFAHQPIEHIRTLACDADSHTSVVLAQIILAERCGIRPATVPLSHASGAEDEALLLIGDKVILDEPEDFRFQYDLGEQWQQMTGLPFVFAIWTARRGVDVQGLTARLRRAKSEGLAHLDQLVQEIAVPRGWPASLARDYLGNYLKFDIGPRELEAIRLFHQLAASRNLISQARPLEIIDS